MFLVELYRRIHEVILFRIDPNEKDHFYSAECDKFMLDRGVLNSSYIINTETNEEIPITYSTESDLDFYFSWISPTLITFKNTEGKKYIKNKSFL